MEQIGNERVAVVVEFRRREKVCRNQIRGLAGRPNLYAASNIPGQLWMQYNTKLLTHLLHHDTLLWFIFNLTVFLEHKLCRWQCGVTLSKGWTPLKVLVKWGGLAGTIFSHCIMPHWWSSSWGRTILYFSNSSSLSENVGCFLLHLLHTE